MGLVKPEEHKQAWAWAPPRRHSVQRLFSVENPSSLERLVEGGFRKTTSSSEGMPAFHVSKLISRKVSHRFGSGKDKSQPALKPAPSRCSRAKRGTFPLFSKQG